MGDILDIVMTVGFWAATVRIVSPLIFGTLGTPDPADVDWINNKKALQYIRSLKKKEPVPLAKVFPNASAQALDLMEKMLTFNPNRRITVEEALAHPYLASLHNEKDEVRDCIAW